MVPVGLSETTTEETSDSMLPAGVVRGIDETAEIVFVNRTKEQIKHAPELDDALLDEDAYRTSVSTYYGPGGAGYRDWDDSL